jgi:hypothetical protein
VQELNLEWYGTTMCIKYIDPADQRKGGRAETTIANLKKLIPAATSEKVCAGFFRQKKRRKMPSFLKQKMTSSHSNLCKFQLLEESSYSL